MVELSKPNNSSGILIWLLQPHAVAGDSISGSVCLDCGAVPADTLTLFLKGTDDLSIWKRHLKGSTRYFKKESKVTQFARVKLVLSKFPEKQTPSGKTCYPFQISLPADLPQSVICRSSKVKSLTAKTTYFLVAELSGGAQKLSSEVEFPIVR